MEYIEMLYSHSCTLDTVDFLPIGANGWKTVALANKQEFDLRGLIFKLVRGIGQVFSHTNNVLVIKFDEERILAHARKFISLKKSVIQIKL